MKKLVLATLVFITGCTPGATAFMQGALYAPKQQPYQYQPIQAAPLPQQPVSQQRHCVSRPGIGYDSNVYTECY